MQVNILEAKNRLSELVKSAEAGEEVIIARRGAPVTKLVAIDRNTGRNPSLGHGAGLVDWLQSRQVSASTRTDEEIERSIQDMRDAWD